MSRLCPEGSYLVLNVVTKNINETNFCRRIYSYILLSWHLLSRRSLHSNTIIEISLEITIIGKLNNNNIIKTINGYLWSDDHLVVNL